MAEDINTKPLAIRDIHEVLIPAMEEVFVTKRDLELYATKQDLKELEAILREEMTVKFDQVLSRSDKILKDLDVLMTEKTVSYHQKKKERKLWTIMIESMREHNILSPKQLEEINALEVF